MLRLRDRRGDPMQCGGSGHLGGLDRPRARCAQSCGGRLASQVRRLADHCPVLMLQGTYSHEPPGTLAIFRLLGGRHSVHVADRIGQVALLSSGAWRASATGDSTKCRTGPEWCSPACRPSTRRSWQRASGRQTPARRCGEHLAELLRGYAPTHRAAQRRAADGRCPHGTVTGCVTEHGVPMAGFDHEFTSGALFAAQAQAFMLGHIHRHQHCGRPGGAGGRRLCRIDRPLSPWRGRRQGLPAVGGRPRRRLSLVPTPARRTVDLFFDGKPDPRSRRRVAEGRRSAGPGSACAGRLPTRIGTRSTTGPSGAHWQALPTCSWKGGSFPSCAAGRRASRAAPAWSTRSEPGRRSPA